MKGNKKNGRSPVRRPDGGGYTLTQKRDGVLREQKREGEGGEERASRLEITLKRMAGAGFKNKSGPGCEKRSQRRRQQWESRKGPEEN